MIGDPAALSGGLDSSTGPIVQLEADGAQVEVDELQALDIESVRRLTSGGVSPSPTPRSSLRRHADARPEEKTCTPTT